MKFKQEAAVGLGSVLIVQVALSALAIALFTRMGPAIGRIVEENVYSVAAVEEMLVALALPVGPERRAMFESALQRAKDNVTEPEEHGLLRVIARDHRAALEGEAAALRSVVGRLKALGKVNRATMARADRSAVQLGRAGGWAAAIMGALALGMGVLVYRRLRLRLELPVVELMKTTDRYRNGNGLARCARTDSPFEIQRIEENLNWMLDRWSASGGAGSQPAFDTDDSLR